MQNVLLQSIRAHVELADGETETLLEYFLPRRLKKRQYLFHSGDVCHHITFVSKGLLRSFCVDENGKEHTMQFGKEQSWISDMGSFLTGEMSVYYIEALEDCEILLLHKQAMNQLVLKFPQLNVYFRLLMQNHIVALQRRIRIFQTHSAEENYRKFLKNQPDLLMRAPQHHIASYLGMTPETLSRVRKQVAGQQ